MMRLPTTTLLSSGLCLLLSGTVASAGAPTEVRAWTGHVEIFTNAQGSVLVAVDRGAPEERDGLADELFVLQQELASAQFVTDSFQTAMVVWAEGRLKVIADDGSRALILALDPAELSGAWKTPRRLAPNAHVARIDGYGLAHHTGGFVTPLVALLHSWGSRPLTKGDLEGPDGGFDNLCDAGGKGSTSCSIEGCSGEPSGCEVECDDGYYACCNCGGLGASCECEKS